MRPLTCALEGGAETRKMKFALHKTEAGFHALHDSVLEMAFLFYFCFLEEIV